MSSIGIIKRLLKLGRHFLEIRDSTPYYKSKPESKWPSFHILLSSHLLRDNVLIIYYQNSKLQYFFLRSNKSQLSLKCGNLTSKQNIIRSDVKCQLQISLNIKFDSFQQEPQNKFGKFKTMKLADAVQSPEDKPLDPHVALEKVLRLDRKHTNFEFFDPRRNVHFKVQNPPLLNDAPPNEHLLRQFWRHAQNYYFRRPQEAQVDRLQYFSSILSEELSHELPFRPSQDFWKGLQMVFNSEYLKKQTASLETNLDARNWFYTLYLYNRLLENQEGKSHKKLEKEYRDLLSARNKIQPYNNNRRFYQSLRVENQQLNKLLPKINQEDDQVADQIRKFQEQLEANHDNTVRLFNQLQKRVSKQQQQKKTIYCFANVQQQIEDPTGRNDEMIISGKLDEVDLQLQYLQYIINCLQRKQVAQSISKITKTQKSRGQLKFLITFEQAMNVKKKSLNQAELVKLNNVREYSLFKFYNTSLKTPYSFICQNFFGFREIYLHRNQPCKYKNKNILDQMKKTTPENPESSKGFQKFDICHHCKLLYPQNFLVKCRYSSERMGIPIQPAPYCDPYLTQISKIQTSKSHRYSMRKRNCFQNYTRMDQEYVCNRKFCKFCLRQNYQDGLDKNGLCPFCQGICFCTRCSRNDMIVRLKGIYLLLGGQMTKFNSDRFLQIQNYEDDDDETKSVRKKGRPKKVMKRLANTPNKASDHINAIRVSLEPLRLLSDMVKKREKIKYKLLQSQQNYFMEKVGMISRDFANGFKNGRNIDSTAQEDSQSLDQIRKKRNHRMI